MEHTVDTLMALADAYADAECSDYLTGEASSLWYRENLRAALTETLQKRDESIDYLTRQCEKYAGQAAQAVPAGFVLVPVEPTQEQLKAATACSAKLAIPSGKDYYRAMLAAAPKGAV